MCYVVRTYGSFGPIQDIHKKLQFGHVVCQMHHIRLKTGHIQTRFPTNKDHQCLKSAICAATYMGGGEDQQRPPSRDQHLGLCEVRDAFFLQLHHVTHQRLHVLGPVLVSPRARKPLQRVLQRLLQRAAGIAQIQLFGYEIWDGVCKWKKWTVFCSRESPDNVVDLQADDFHDKGTCLQNTRLRITDKCLILNDLSFSY